MRPWGGCHLTGGSELLLESSCFRFTTGCSQLRHPLSLLQPLPVNHLFCHDRSKSVKLQAKINLPDIAAAAAFERLHGAVWKSVVAVLPRKRPSPVGLVSVTREGSSCLGVAAGEAPEARSYSRPAARSW